MNPIENVIHGTGSINTIKIQTRPERYMDIESWPSAHLLLPSATVIYFISTHIVKMSVTIYEMPTLQCFIPINNPSSNLARKEAAEDN